MRISLSPIRCDHALEVELSGDVLILNGDAFDFSVLPEGATLPQAAIMSDWITGPVTRLQGELSVALALPHGVDAPAETLIPQTIHVVTDGPVALPPYEV